MVQPVPHRAGFPDLAGGITEGHRQTHPPETHTGTTPRGQKSLAPPLGDSGACAPDLTSLTPLNMKHQAFCVSDSGDQMGNDLLTTWHIIAAQ